MTDLAHDLRRLVTEGGDANRLVLETERGYLVIRAAEGADAVEVEVSAGRQLPGSQRLSDRAHQALHEAGFRRRSAAGNYRRRRVPLEGLAPALDDWVALLEAEGSAQRTLRLGDRERTTNPELISAMKRLSQARDMRARREVYMAVLRADLLVATEAPPDETGPLQLKAVGRLARLAVAAVFTDWDALERYEPRGLDYAVRPGLELFPLLAREKVGSLLINPRGRVGGELYRNEILTISEGAARLTGRS